MTIIYTLLGLTLLALTYFDIWATVLHPGIESPLSNRFHRAVWRTLRLLARVTPWADQLLSAGLPLMIGGLVATWLIFLVVGFALLYFPWILDPAAFITPPDLAGTWFDAIYISGTTLFTLGYGDITPRNGLLHILTILEAGSGMATISFSVAYVLGVYPALTRLRIRTTVLDAEVGGQISGLPLLQHYLYQGRWQRELSDRLRELALELLELIENHEAHPVLYYSHPTRAQHSIVRMLVTIQELIGLLRYSPDPTRHPDLVRDPQLLLLEQVFHYCLHQLATSLHAPDLGATPSVVTEQQYIADFRKDCAAIAHLGFTPADQEATATAIDVHPLRRSPNAPARIVDSSCKAYITFRQETDPYLAAYAAASGYAAMMTLREDDPLWASPQSTW